MGLIWIINKTNKLKLPRTGKTGQLAGLAWQGRAKQSQARPGQARPGQARPGQASRISTQQGKIIKGYKYKEIIKGANEERNEEKQVGQINQ